MRRREGERYPDVQTASIEEALMKAPVAGRPTPVAPSGASVDTSSMGEEEAIPAVPMAGSELEPRAQRWSRWLGAALGVVIFAVALYSLRQEFGTYTVRQVRFAVRTLDPIFVVRGALFAIGAYAVLIAYDVLALRYIKSDLPTRRIAFISFIAFSFSNALGFPLLLGGGLRYRLYNAAGLSSADIAVTIAFNTATFWLGVLSATGVSLLVAPGGTELLFGIPLSSLRPVGVLLLLSVAAYLLACAWFRRPIRIFDWEFAPPSGRMALVQVAVAFVDWVLVAAVLWAVLPLPPANLTFGLVLCAFVLAQVAGLVSHVPGGLGVFEFTFVALLSRYVEPTRLLGAVIVFRIIYYLFPLGDRARPAGGQRVRTRPFAAGARGARRERVGAGRGAGALLAHDVHRRHDPALLRRDAGDATEAALRRRPGPARGDRVLALRRESHGRGAAHPRARPRSPPRRRLLPDRRRPPRWHRHVAPEGVGLRGGRRARVHSHHAHPGAASFLPARVVHGGVPVPSVAADDGHGARASAAGWDSSHTRTSRIRTISGGSSRCRATRRVSSGRWSACRSASRSLALHRLLRPVSWKIHHAGQRDVWSEWRRSCAPRPTRCRTSHSSGTSRCSSRTTAPRS